MLAESERRDRGSDRDRRTVLCAGSRGTIARAAVIEFTLNDLNKVTLAVLDFPAAEPFPQV